MLLRLEGCDSEAIEEIADHHQQKWYEVICGQLKALAPLTSKTLFRW